MDTKLINRIFGILSFFMALLVYILTVQPTVPFWDCGEFSAASIWQQVPHPPGAPLFLMIGKLFHIILPFGDPGWRLNMVSVVSSALTVWLLYLISVKIILNFRKEQIETTADALAVYGASFVGAMALVFSDTFWFNAVESEVYAISSLFVALVVFLMMKWNEEADKPGHERYLLLIAYLMGLSTGVHLLALQAIFAIVFMVYFRKYEFKISSFLLTGIIASMIFFVIYPGIVKWIPAMLDGNMPFKNECREYVVEGNFLISAMVVGVVILAGVGLWYGYKRRLNTLNLICSAFLLMIFGYSTYTQILLRSNANPPMNENEPKDLHSLTSYLGREQYGDSPFWPRRYHSNDDYYTNRYIKKNDKGEYVYGPWIPPERVETRCKDGRTITVPEFNKVNFGGEVAFLWKYQIDHMYLRYFLWNYVGRSGDLQDAGWAFTDESEAKQINKDSGYKESFPIKFYALPLLLGLIGLLFHFYRDPKMAFLYLLLFILMGIATAVYQNQQEPQPRERDYFYAGSFFIFCIWIGLGAYGLVKGLEDRKIAAPIVAGILALCLILVPVNMAVGGWRIHSRAGNYLPFDYSYNILQSTEQDAIVFTNGDNDTFPLWYLQDVNGVRRDVRVVNLSLGNTLWYVDQLKNRQPWGAKKIPLSFADDSLQVDEMSPLALSYDFGEARNVSIPVDREILSQYTNDPAAIQKGTWDFTFVGKRYGQHENKTLYIYRVQDKLILDILQQVRFSRPVYFSVTVGPDAFCGLDKYFRHEGMAMRICPVEQKSSVSEAVDPDVMEACLMNVDNTDNFSKTPKYGFKFRNLNNMDVYYDEVHRRLMTTYRTLFMSYANYAVRTMKDNAKGTAVLDQMNKQISPVQFPMGLDQLYRVTLLYKETDAMDQVSKYAKSCIDQSMQIINDPDIRPELEFYEVTGRYFGPYSMASACYEMLGDYEGAINVLQMYFNTCQRYLQQYGSDPSYSQEMQRIGQNMFTIQANMGDYSVEKAKKEEGLQAAIDMAKSLIEEYEKEDSPNFRQLVRYMEQKIMRMQVELNPDTVLFDNSRPTEQ